MQIPESLTFVDVAAIELDPDNVRSQYEDEYIEQLRAALASAVAKGEQYIHPPTVYKLSRDRFRVKHGNCRVLAAQGVVDMLCVRVVDPPASSGEKILDQLSENLLHGGLSPMDTAHAMKRLRQTEELSISGLVDALTERGISRGKFWVKMHLGLLDLHPAVQELVRGGRIPVRTAWLLHSLPSAEQVTLAQQIISEGLTRQQLEEKLGPGAHAEEVQWVPQDGNLETIHAGIQDLIDRASQEAPARNVPLQQPEHRAGKVAVRWELIPAAIGEAQSDKRLVSLGSKAWVKSATDFDRQLAHEAVVFGDYSPEQAIELVERVGEELADAPTHLLMALNSLREVAEHPVQLTSHNGLGALVAIRMRRVMQALGRSSQPVNA